MSTTELTRTPAWKTIGGFVRKADGGLMTSKQAMKAGNLAGWNVRKEAMFTASGIEIPNRVATVRNDLAGGTEYLGYVGHNYTIQQNEETFEFLDTLAEVSGAQYDAAGYLGRGQRIFTAMKLPEGIRIGGEDAIDLYLLVGNGHDGFHAFDIAVTPLRLACTNQLTAAFRGASQRFKIRHTSGMAGRIAEARSSLELTFEAVDAFTAEMEALLDDAMTPASFDKMVAKSILPDAKTDGRQEAVEAKRAVLSSLFTTSPTNEFGRGTKYAAFNALTEYADWIAPAKSDTARAERIMVGTTTQAFKDRALKVLRTV